MNSKIKRFLLSLLSFALVFTWFQGKPVLAANSEEDFIWEVTKEGTARIVEYVGTKKDVVIPRELGGLPVTEIGGNAFFDSGITSVIIPDTVKAIGSRSFAFNKLKKIVIPDSVEVIAPSAFAYNELEEVVLSKNVKELTFFTFAHNKIKKIVIPESVNSIGFGDFAFNELEKVVLSNNIQFIGDLTFVGNKLKEIYLPRSLEILSPFAFGLNELEKVVVESEIFNLYYNYLDDVDENVELWGVKLKDMGLFYNFESEYDMSNIMDVIYLWENNLLRLVRYENLTFYGHDNAKQYAEENNYRYFDISEYVPEEPEETPSNNPTTIKQQDVSIEILGDGLSLETSPIQSFGNIALKGEPKTYKTSFESPIKIKDLRGTHEGWTLSVQASQFTNENGYKLPKGSITLDGVKTVNGESEINVHLNQTTVIDDGSVIVAHANEGQGMGAVELIFNDDAIGLTIDPATAKLGTYTSTITWTLQATPIAD